ncbi:DUF4377 domain-containing protein [Alistipes putredinis]|uniref:DUF4377 domain-containing protein n=1 Tax=Alistipes putredinis TaxID=28117 RepID=UPI0039677A81
MKATNLGILILFFCTFSFISCDDNDKEGRKVTGYKEYILTVASEKVPGVLWSEGYNYLSEVYAVKKEQSDEWSAFGSIDGFEFVKGYEYQIKISETSYLDYAMGDPAWTERDLLEIISKNKKDSEDLPLHFIPKAYYDNVPFPQYRYAVDADNKELIEQDLKDHSLIPLDYHNMVYRGEDNFLRWIALQDDSNTFGPYIIKTISKKPEEMPESYKLLPPEAQIVGYGEWTFLDEAGIAIDNLSFDVFMGYAAQAKDIDRTPTVVYLYKDLTEYYRTKYPEAGVKTVVVSYKTQPM